jgi:uncharacterized protein (DUF342 family)
MNDEQQFIEQEKKQGQEQEEKLQFLENRVTVPLSLKVSDDKMELLVSGDVRGWKKEELVDILVEKLKEEKITQPELVESAKKRLLEIIEQEEIFENIILLRGKEPVPPVEGKIEWEQDFFAQGYEIDPETGMMDYRKPKAKKNVEAGQLLATIVLPKEGEDGIDFMVN